MERCYALFSGGFDSSLAIAKYLGEHPKIDLTPVYFNYGQKSKENEMDSVTQLTNYFKELAKDSESMVHDSIILNLSEAKPSSLTIFSWSDSSILNGREDLDERAGLENRNMIFLSCLASLIQANGDGINDKTKTYIITGFTNSYPDTSIQFVKSFNQTLKTIGLYVEVVAPLMSLKQKGPVGEEKLAKLTDKFCKSIPLDRIAWSCYFPKELGPCGKCEPCLKRKRITQKIGMRRVHKLRYN